jgi:hypothetical protein
MVTYRDPYGLQNNTHEHDFNPYSSQQPHDTYEQGGIGPTYDSYENRYTDEAQAFPPQRSPSQRSPGGKEGAVSPDGYTPTGGEKCVCMQCLSTAYEPISLLKGPHAPYETTDTTTKGSYGQR